MKRTILYVDDEADNLIVFQATFAEQFEVLVASSAQEALSILEQTPVAVVVSDQRMPQTTGVELFGILRQKHPHTQRILLTGYAEPKAMIDAINIGQVFYYASKPWDCPYLEQVLLKAVEIHDISVSVAERSRLLAKENNELRAALAEACELRE
ncbi:MAG TPA: response regulator [Pirellulales bacterium]|nr:response regulator [Pirellulales bacterium]